MTSDAGSVSLGGRVAIVTGGSRGIGKAIALVLAQRGASIAVVSNNPAKAGDARETVHEIEALGSGVRAISIIADVADADACKRIVQEARKGLGVDKIDILVNNAGVGDTTPTADVTPELFDRIISVNLRGPYFLFQATLPYLPPGGRVINVSSIAARSITSIPIAAYAASKSGLDALSRTWAGEFGQSHGITVNSVATGFVETDMAMSLPGEVLAAVRDNNAKETAAAPRSGTPDDIAQAIAFLASEGARWVTGSSLSANGGRIAI
ncbi:MAG: hypothetical protein M1832_004911 [Thelocarpon impressellum]|nr:MAG: hypothetical protein M1832_004911 [Thelocarpon impressellum]